MKEIYILHIDTIIYYTFRFHSIDYSTCNDKPYMVKIFDIKKMIFVTLIRINKTVKH